MPLIHHDRFNKAKHKFELTKLGWSSDFAPHSLSRVGQNRVYTLYMIVCLVMSLSKIPYIHRIYIWFWPTLIVSGILFPCATPSQSTVSDFDFNCGVNPQGAASPDQGTPPDSDAGRRNSNKEGVDAIVRGAAAATAAAAVQQEKAQQAQQN